MGAQTLSDPVPKLIEGGISVDDRGSVSFVNDFWFPGVKRFYVVKNHERGFVRAWHAHKHESKWLTIVSGTALAGTVKIVGDINKPDKLDIPSGLKQRHILSATKPSILYIPAGYANGLKVLTNDYIAIYFSNKTAQETGDDDYRYPWYYFGESIWEVVQR